MKLINFLGYKISKLYGLYNEQDPEIYVFGGISLIVFLNYYLIRALLIKFNLVKLNLSDVSIIGFFILTFLLLAIKHYFFDKNLLKVEKISFIVSIINYLSITFLSVLIFYVIDLILGGKGVLYY